MEEIILNNNITADPTFLELKESLTRPPEPESLVYTATWIALTFFLTYVCFALVIILPPHPEDLEKKKLKKKRSKSDLDRGVTQDIMISAESDDKALKLYTVHPLLAILFDKERPGQRFSKRLMRLTNLWSLMSLHGLFNCVLYTRINHSKLHDGQIFTYSIYTTGISIIIMYLSHGVINLIRYCKMRSLVKRRGTKANPRLFSKWDILYRNWTYLVNFIILMGALTCYVTEMKTMNNPRLMDQWVYTCLISLFYDLICLDIFMIFVAKILYFVAQDIYKIEVFLCCRGFYQLKSGRSYQAVSALEKIGKAGGETPGSPTPGGLLMQTPGGE